MGKNNFDPPSKPPQNVIVTCFIMSYSSGSASDPVFFPEQTPQHDEEGRQVELLCAAKHRHEGFSSSSCNIHCSLSVLAR